jgi:hypothetical protein
MRAQQAVVVGVLLRRALIVSGWTARISAFFQHCDSSCFFGTATLDPKTFTYSLIKKLYILDSLLLFRPATLSGPGQKSPGP